jgi:DNA-directed RNA polymerase subunit RPC12/RpoP
MSDDLDQFVGYDLMGSGEETCPNCGEHISTSLLIDDNEIECPRCGHKFKPKQPS